MRALEVKNQEGRPVITGVCTVLPSVCEGKKKHKRRFPKMKIKPPFLPMQSLTPPTSQSQALQAQLCSFTIKPAPLWRETFIHTLFLRGGGGESTHTTNHHRHPTIQADGECLCSITSCVLVHYLFRLRTRLLLPSPG